MGKIKKISSFLEEINKYNLENNILNEKIEVQELIDNMYVSPSVKRAIKQSYKIYEEIVKVLGKEPKKMFVEVARGGERVKQRTASRKKKLEKIYKNLKSSDEKELLAEIEGQDHNKLNSKKLFLYYLQLGKCMYSGNRIDLNNFSNYDIDHIYPRAYTKDDSFNNLVLVENKLNRDKEDKYPIESDIQKRMEDFWKYLMEKELITKNKYERLIRKTELSDDELANFINRQLVELRQSSKAFIELIKLKSPNVDVVYSKSINVSEFRQEFNIIKIRGLNDLHHAKDAYLNIVVGNVFDTKFTKNPLNFLKSKNNKYSLKAEVLYKHNVERNAVKAWDKDKSIETVMKNISRNDIMYTVMQKIEKGQMFDLNIVKAGKGQYPIKENEKRLENIERYGAFNSSKTAFFAQIEYINKKGKKEVSIESVPVFIAKKIKNNELTLKEYFENNIALKEVKILIEKIKINSVFEIEGNRYIITGKFNDYISFKNGEQLKLKEPIEKEEIKKHKKLKQILYGNSKGIDSEILDEIYSKLMDKMKNKKYKSIYKNVIKTIENSLELFKTLEIEDKIYTIREIFKILNCTSQLGNLTKIKGVANSGKLYFSKNKIKGKIINQSITGLFENEIRLK